ncbi:MAG: twin-arginine translocase TatA/TatE family subunit [Dehalococcoidia bacterium]
MPFHMGPMEIGIILVIVLIIFGVGKLPQVGGAIGKSIREFRKEKEAVDEKPAEKDIAKSSETDAKEKA